MFTNTCVVRAPGPELANVTVPLRFFCFTGSSGMRSDDQSCETVYGFLSAR
jgi:hypothetical protein